MVQVLFPDSHSPNPEPLARVHLVAQGGPFPHTHPTTPPWFRGHIGTTRTTFAQAFQWCDSRFLILSIACGGC